MLHLVSLLASAIGIVTADSAELRREPLMAALRSGGYTVILRHARTDRSFQEERSFVPKERSAQRNLTDEGVRDAALMGVVFRKYHISFAEILSSPMFRSVETAEMAAGRPETTMVLRTYPSTPEQAALIARPPKPGTNRLLVTHHFVIEAHVPGISPGEIGESEAVVVRHTAGGAVVLVGRITLDDWQVLANPDRAVSRAPAPAQTVAGHGASGGWPIPGASVHLPDTHAGHVARDYIVAFNSGDAARMRSFIESSMLPDAARPTEQRLALYAQLFEQHGPLSVDTIEVSQSTEVILGMRSKQGKLRLTVKTSESQPMRATLVTFTFAQGGHP